MYFLVTNFDKRERERERDKFHETCEGLFTSDAVAGWFAVS